MKSLSLHLVFATSTTRQLVIPILHVKPARKHSCEFPQRSRGGHLKTHPDIHVRFVWDTRKESVEDRLARKRKRKKAGLGWPTHYHLPAFCCFHDTGQDHGSTARTVLYNHVWQPVRHPVIPMAAAPALCNHIWLWRFGSKSWWAKACYCQPYYQIILSGRMVWRAGVAVKQLWGARWVFVLNR